MRTITGGIGRPGGDGVIHSPTSVVTSATTPSNGARSTVFSRVTRATSSAAWACAMRARGALTGRGCGIAFALELIQDL